MTKFTITQDQIERLRAFAGYLTKLNSFIPIDTRQQFCINGAKLEIYAIGKNSSTGQCEIAVDLTNVSIDTRVSNLFSTNINTIITYFDRINSADADISVTDRQLIVTGKNAKEIYKITLLPVRDDIDDIKSFISDQLNQPAFDSNSRAEINTAGLFDDLALIVPMIKILEFRPFSQIIEVGNNSIKASNQIIIFEKNTNFAMNKTVYIHGDLIPLLKDCKLIVSSNNHYYINFDTLGIKLFVVPPASNYKHPSEKEKELYCPSADNVIKIEVNAKKLYEALHKFDGVFSLDNWPFFNHAFIKTPIGFDSDKELILYWIDAEYTIEINVPVSIITRADTSEDFEFMIPAKFIKSLEPYFLKDGNSVISIEYNSIPEWKDHGKGIKLYNDNVSVILTKLR